MKVRVIDGNGTTAVIDEDLAVESEEPVSEELRSFLDRTRRSSESNSLKPEFLIDLYVRTPVRRVEPQPSEGGPKRVRWNRRPARYGPPTGGPGGSTDGERVDHGDGFAPDATTQSTRAGE